MAAPAYTTDLTTFNLMDAAPTVGEATGYTTTGVAALDTDYPIHNTGHLSAAMTKTGLGSIMADFGSNITWTSGDVFLVWAVFLPAGAVNTVANGGLQILIGSALTAFEAFYVGGRDFGRYPYGGWMNFAVDPEVTADVTTGTPTAYRWVGVGVDCTSAISKGSPLGLDAIRYGRAELRINGGEGPSNYATFAGAAATNDATTARWGLFQAEAGSYRWKGLMTLGYTSAIDFRDSNRNIVVDDTRKVTSGFNKIEVRQGTSVVDWTSINIQSLGTVSPGAFECIDNATVNFESCVFTDMGSFIFKSASTINNTVFRRCGQITANNAVLTNCTFTGYEGVGSPTPAQLIWDTADDPNGNLDGSTFIKGTTENHAIEFGTTSPLAMTLTNVFFTGYDGSPVPSAAIHFKRTTGTVTLTIVGGDTPSYRSDGATIDIVTGTRTITVTVTDISGTPIQNANVYLQVSASAASGLPYNQSVSISNSGTTATVTDTAHTLKTNDYVKIEGSPIDTNNGVKQITVTGVNTYTYTITSNTSGPHSCTATFIVVKGLTDVNGQISLSRVIPANQAIAGWARKSSPGSPTKFYKTGNMTGTMSSSDDTNLSALLILDQ